MALGIDYYKVKDFNLVEYFESHWAGFCDDKNITRGCV